MQISSVGDRSARLTRLRRLKQARYRQRQSLLLVEGATLLREALRSGLSVVDVVVSRQAYAAGRLQPLLADLQAAQVRQIGTVAERQLATLSTLKTAHDVIAVVQLPEKRVDVWTVERLIAFDGLQDPGNVGTGLRSALAFGIDYAWLSHNSVDVYSPKVLRASAGAIFSFSGAEHVDLAARLQEAGRRGYAIFGLDADRGVDVRKLQPCSRYIVVVGSEGRGLSAEVGAAISHWVRVPIDRRVESLNAGVAAGIVLYELSKDK